MDKYMIRYVSQALRRVYLGILAKVICWKVRFTLLYIFSLRCYPSLYLIAVGAALSRVKDSNNVHYMEAEVYRYI